MIVNIALLWTLATKNDLQAPADARLQNYRNRSSRNSSLRTSLAVGWLGSDSSAGLPLHLTVSMRDRQNNIHERGCFRPLSFMSSQ
jgi:hypothetical protein